MTESTAGQFLIAALVFAAILTGVFTLIGPAIDTSTQNYNDYNRSLNVFGELQDKSDQIQTKVQAGSNTEEGIFGIVNALVKRTLGIFPLLWQSFDVLAQLISELGQGALGIPIPAWFTGLIVAILIISIAFALMAAWFKWRI